MPATAEGPGKSEEALAEVGRKLVGRDGGLACVTGHSVVDTRAASPFEAPAPNLMHVPERLTHDYYVRWMRKPMRFTCPAVTRSCMRSSCRRPPRGRHRSAPRRIQSEEGAREGGMVVILPTTR